MPNESDIKELIGQIQQLQIQQYVLIQRLEDLTGRGRSPSTPTSDPRQFAIGDRVRITNPRRLQPRVGRIIKINTTTDRITIKPRTGIKIVRASKHVALEPELTE